MYTSVNGLFFFSFNYSGRFFYHSGYGEIESRTWLRTIRAQCSMSSVWFPGALSRRIPDSRCWHTHGANGLAGTDRDFLLTDAKALDFISNRKCEVARWPCRWLWRTQSVRTQCRLDVGLGDALGAFSSQVVDPSPSRRAPRQTPVPQAVLVHTPGFVQQKGDSIGVWTRRELPR